MTPGPGWRKCNVYRQTGPGGMPLALRLSEGLGRTSANDGGDECSKRQGEYREETEHEPKASALGRLDVCQPIHNTANEVDSAQCSNVVVWPVPCSYIQRRQQCDQLFKCIHLNTVDALELLGPGDRWRLDSVLSSCLPDQGTKGEVLEHGKHCHYVYGVHGGFGLGQEGEKACVVRPNVALSGGRRPSA